MSSTAEKENTLYFQKEKKKNIPLNATLGGHKQRFVCTRSQEKGTETLQENEPDLPMSVW